MPETTVLLASRYKLQSRIAAGGMGEVWRARDTVLDRPVAVKLLRAESAGQPETLARFRAEARHAGALSHPNIAQVYDYGEAEPPHAPFLVMELVDGPSLAGPLAHGPLDPGRSMDVLAQAAAGLAAAHAAGVIHRDIKPANLLLAPDGIVKITDFGIAHAAGSAPLTRTGLLIGTAAYLAPERAGGATATAASDLYSLGVVGYECLGGVPPFRGTPLEVASAHQRGKLPPLPPDVPAAAAAMVSRLTARDPAGRPASAAEVAAWAARVRDDLTGRTALLTGAGPGSCPAPTRALPLTGAGAAAAGAILPGSDSSPRGNDGSLPAITAGLPLAEPGPPRPGPRQQPWQDGLRSWQDGLRSWQDGLRSWQDGLRSWRDGLRSWRDELRSRQRLRSRRDERWPGRRVALAVAGVAIIAGLTGWLLGGTAGTPHPAGPSAPARQASRTVTVDGAALAGQPVGAVRQQLSQLGLQPQVVWVPAHGQPPGTVLSVQPSGQVPAGSSVTVTAALPGPGHGHDGPGPGKGGDGHGNGGG